MDAQEVGQSWMPGTSPGMTSAVPDPRMAGLCPATHDVSAHRCNLPGLPSMRDHLADLVGGAVEMAAEFRVSEEVFGQCLAGLTPRLDITRIVEAADHTAIAEIIAAALEPVLQSGELGLQQQGKQGPGASMRGRKG